MIRSVTTKLSNNMDVELRIGVHRPQKPTENGPVASGDPYPVVEIWVLDESVKDRYRRVTGMRMEDFTKLARDVVDIGKDLLHDQDEPATGE